MNSLDPASHEGDYSSPPFLTEDQCKTLWQFVTTRDPELLPHLKQIPACMEAVSNTTHHTNELENWNAYTISLVKSMFGSVTTQAKKGLENTAKKLNYANEEGKKPDMEFLQAVFQAVTDREIPQEQRTHLSPDEKIELALMDIGFWAPTMYVDYAAKIWIQEAEEDRQQADPEDMDRVLTPLKELLGKYIRANGLTSIWDEHSEDFIMEYISGQISYDTEVFLEVRHLKYASDWAMANKLIPSLANSGEQEAQMRVANFYSQYQELLKMMLIEIKKERGELVEEETNP